MSVADHEAAQRLIARYDALAQVRDRISELYDLANSGEGTYDEPDELALDLNSDLAGIADEAVDLLSKVTFR